MKLSKRLEKIANHVSHLSVVDVGTDHAFIPIYLASNRISTKIAACDINIGPLDSAKINITNSNLTNQIQTRLGSGLSKILPNEFECCIIAGMGGMLTIDILNQNLDVAKSFKQLILQPQKDIPEVRKFLAKNNFHIYKEEIIKDSDIFYNIIVAKPCNPKVDDIHHFITEKEMTFGCQKTHTNLELLKQYVEFLITKQTTLYKKINSENNETTDKRKKEILKTIQISADYLSLL